MLTNHTIQSAANIHLAGQAVDAGTVERIASFLNEWESRGTFQVVALPGSNGIVVSSEVFCLKGQEDETMGRAADWVEMVLVAMCLS